MSRSRINLQHKLEQVMAEAYQERLVSEPNITDFSNNVYFQAPSRMHYPAILYERSSADTTFADNRPYMYQHQYMITVIDPDPDSIIPDKIAMLPQCVFDRHYVADNLHHTTFMIYY